MTARLRILDLGLRESRRHVAVEAALLQSHREGASSDLLSFEVFDPCVFIGRYQNLAHEVDLAACAQAGVQLARRLSGGGAVYVDRAQLCWSVIAARKTCPGDLSSVAVRLLGALAGALRELGLDASYRPRNDIEVGGRKIVGSAGYFDGPSLLFHGTLLLDLDLDAMRRMLRSSLAKMARHGTATPAGRVTCLRAELGAVPPLAEIRQAIAEAFAGALGARPEPGQLTPRERLAAEQFYLGEIGTDAFVDSVASPLGPDWSQAELTVPGGMLALHLRLAGRSVADAAFVGDPILTPPRLLLDLEAALRGVSLDGAAGVAREMLSSAAPDGMSFDPGALVDLVARAAQRR